MTVPVDPDADEAARWLRDELAKPAYQEARPSWFDRFAQSVWEWLLGLRGPELDGPADIGRLIVVLVIVAVIVTAFFIFGRPALARRSKIAGSLFGEDDARDAAAMRRDAERAAASGAWADAIADMFRAVARGLSERAIVRTSPGTTAQDFAAAAARAFPALSSGLVASSATFDSVRYLGRAGSPAEYSELAELERALRAATPVLAEPAAEATA
jgi:hypothetical protein